MNKQYRLFISFFFFFLSLNLSAQTITRLQDFKKTLEIRKRSIVKIEVFNEQKRILFGTGFFIDSIGTIATNFHVLYPTSDEINRVKAFEKKRVYMNDLIKNSKYSYRITFNDGQKAQSIKLLGCGNANNIDLCQLKVERKNNAFIPIENNKIGLGNTVYSIGFCKDEINYKKGIIDEYHKDFLSQYDQWSYNLNQKTPMINISNNICKGDSGGPILSSNGVLLGMTTIYFQDKNKKWNLGILYSELNKIDLLTDSYSLRLFKNKIHKKKRNRNPFEI